MTAILLASCGLIAILTWLLTRMIFPDQCGILYCPRWLPVTWHVRFLEQTTWLRKLAEAIHLAAIYFHEPDVENVILAPAGSWSFLSETLELDAESAAFDDGLKDEIRQALCKIIIW